MLNVRRKLRKPQQHVSTQSFFQSRRTISTMNAKKASFRRIATVPSSLSLEHQESPKTHPSEA